MLFNVVLSQTEEVWGWIFSAIKRVYDRGCCKPIRKFPKPRNEVNTKKVIQSDLEKLYTGAEVKSFNVYSNTFTTLWVIMMYSSGMPILYVVGFLSFMFAYLAQKCYLLKYHRKTTSFDSEMAHDTIPLFRIAIIMHLAMSGIMLTNKNILSVQNLRYLSQVSIVKDVPFIDQFLLENTFSQRFTDGIGLVYLCFVVLIVAQFIFRKVFGVLFLSAFRNLCGVACACCLQSEKQKEREKSFHRKRGVAEGKDTYSVNFFGDLRITPLSDLYNRAVLELDEMKWDAMPKGVDPLEYDAVFKQFQERKKRIETVCDFHLKELLKVTKQGSQSDMLSFEFKKKFLILQANEPILLKSYRRQKTPLLRMKGITQSYYQYDSDLFKNAKPMIAKIKTEDIKTKSAFSRGDD